MPASYHIAIRKIRKKSGYSQEYVAEKIKVARTTYVQIEKGERELNLSEAIELAHGERILMFFRFGRVFFTLPGPSILIILFC
jgi:DNA-binding XRE family transcriptional regulator